MALSLNHLLALDWKTWASKNSTTDALPISIFAFSDNVTTQNKTLWDGLPVAFSFPSSATTMSMVSTATYDVNAVVAINGLDSNWNQINESVTLNGTTPVATTNSFLRINGMTMTAPGSGQTSNAGIITAKSSAVTYSQINATIGKTQTGIYTVPSGFTFFVYSVNCFSGDAGASNYVTFNVKVTPNASPTPTTYTLLQTTWLEYFTVQRIVPQIQLQKSDIQWQFKVNSGTQTISLIVQGYLIANN